MDIGEILDLAKKRQGIRTDMALAEALDVSRSAVSSWRKGVQLPDAVRCAALAGLTGEPLARVLGIVGEARAISREEKSVWRKLAASAAAVVLMLAATPLAAPPRARGAGSIRTHLRCRHYANFQAEPVPAMAMAALDPIHATPARTGQLGGFRMLTDSDPRPCHELGTKPNACARAHYRRIAENHVHLSGPWAGWRLAGRDLVSPDRQRISPERLRGILFQETARKKLARSCFRKIPAEIKSLPNTFFSRSREAFLLPPRERFDGQA